MLPSLIIPSGWATYLLTHNHMFTNYPYVLQNMWYCQLGLISIKNFMKIRDIINYQLLINTSTKLALAAPACCEVTCRQTVCTQATTQQQLAGCGLVGGWGNRGVVE